MGKDMSEVIQNQLMPTVLPSSIRFRVSRAGSRSITLYGRGALMPASASERGAFRAALHRADSQTAANSNARPVTFGDWDTRYRDGLVLLALKGKKGRRNGVVGEDHRH